MTQIVLKLLPKKFLVAMLLLITLQQILVAASTALLGLAGRHLSNPGEFKWILVGFLVCSTLPHGISLLLKKLELQGYFDAYFEFVRQRLLAITGRPQKWQNHQQKESFLTALGPDAEGYLTAVAFSVFDIYLFALTILLNVLSISLVVDKSFSYIFAVSGVLSAIVFFLFSKKVESEVEKEQTSKIDFFSYILKSWDNILLKNTPVNQIYTGALQAKYQGARKDIGRAALHSEGLVFVLTLLSSLPVFGLILWLAMTHQNDSAFLAGLLVTIPKQIMILGNFRAFFNQITNLAAFKARFKTSWENSTVPDNDLQSRINVPQITLNQQTAGGLKQLQELISAQGKGRLVVRGKNGAGKSTFLLHLNQELPDSFFLPANPQLEIAKDLGTESTGERILKYLEFIRQQPTSVLLLDEWDANLDRDNKAKIERELDILAESKLIIEVRHHGA